jgi:hypothetical protein
MATDIADKDLKTERNASMGNRVLRKYPSGGDTDQPAASIIDHLMHGDVSQRCSTAIISKWNERSSMKIEGFSGRSCGDQPVDNWYKSEMGFFDFYIIPPAEKLE